MFCAGRHPSLYSNSGIKDGDEREQAGSLLVACQYHQLSVVLIAWATDESLASRSLSPSIPVVLNPDCVLESAGERKKQAWAPTSREFNWSGGQTSGTSVESHCFIFQG